MKLSGLSNISFSSASQGIHKEQYGEYAATLDCKGLKNKVTIRIQQREEGNLLLMFFLYNYKKNNSASVSSGIHVARTDQITALGLVSRTNQITAFP